VPDTRTGKRFPLTLATTIRGGKKSVKKGTTSDLSAAGVFIMADADFEVGTKVEFDITLPAAMIGANKDVEVRCQGRVVRELSLADSTPQLDVELAVMPHDRSVIDGLCQFGTNVETTADGKIRLRVRSEPMIPEIVRWLVSRGVDVHSVTSRRKSLEQWFLDVMGEDQRPG